MLQNMSQPTMTSPHSKQQPHTSKANAWRCHISSYFSNTRQVSSPATFTSPIYKTRLYKQGLGSKNRRGNAKLSGISHDGSGISPDGFLLSIVFVCIRTPENPLRGRSEKKVTIRIILGPLLSGLPGLPRFLKILSRLRELP